VLAVLADRLDLLIGRLKDVEGPLDLDVLRELRLLLADPTDASFADTVETFAADAERMLRELERPLP